MSEQAENIRVGYQAALDVANCENKLIWSEFNNLILINSIVVSATILSNLDYIFVKIIFHALGILISLLLYFAIRRGFKYLDFYKRNARLFEKDLSPLKMISEGKNLAEGMEYTVGEEKFPCNKWLNIKARCVISLIILLLVLVHFLCIFFWIFN